MTGRIDAGANADAVLADLHGQLQTALREGRGTGAIRRRIEAEESAQRMRHAADNRAAEAAARRIQAERVSAISTAASALARPAIARIAAQLTALEPPPL